MNVLVQWLSEDSRLADALKLEGGPNLAWLLEQTGQKAPQDSLRAFGAIGDYLHSNARVPIVTIDPQVWQHARRDGFGFST